MVERVVWKSKGKWMWELEAEIQGTYVGRMGFRRTVGDRIWAWRGRQDSAWAMAPLRRRQETGDRRMSR